MPMGVERVVFAFAMTLFAGLATGVGSLIGLLSRRFSPKFLAVSLGFSAGVMVYVSLVEILSKARSSLAHAVGEGMGAWLTVLAFFAGIAVITLIDRLIPSYENPHELDEVGSGKRRRRRPRRKDLMRMGLFSALAIGVHNFPEGLASFMAALDSPVMGITIALAIAIHNIPEGLAVSVPIYYATHSRRKAFYYSFLSGLAEPVGALLGFLVLRPFFSEAVFGAVFAAVAGVMVYISFDELLPTAEAYGEHHTAIVGVMAGMAVMAVSLVLFL